jgi:hypothetical protein
VRWPAVDHRALPVYPQDAAPGVSGRHIASGTISLDATLADLGMRMRN